MSEMSEEYIAEAKEKFENREFKGRKTKARLIGAYHEGEHPDGRSKIFHLIKTPPVPIFRDWSFETNIEYDSSVVSARQLRQIFKNHGMKNGFGDWRPTFGRAKIELTYEGLVH